ncbi:hypothetical protein ABZ471_25475 [Streptomyces sp. NPDC005728]|uniref:hypothetical protein n=1 Tax=Streptomyces sp. NPDC005728 TaxID=3157054 RepID=UPI0033E6947E
MEVEVGAHSAELGDERDDKGHRLVVRKRVGEATGVHERLSSAILPPWCRNSPKISEGPVRRRRHLRVGRRHPPAHTTPESMSRSGRR